VTDRPSESRAPERDQIKPFHARDASSGQEAADTVAAVLKHAAARDEAAKKRTAPKAQPIWMLPLALTMAVLATFLLVAPPAWVELSPLAAQEPEAALASTQRAVYMFAQRIEGYRMTNGRLPLTLADAGVSVENLEYSILGTDFLLTARVGGRDVVYNSSEPLQAWATRLGVSFQLGG
jgi:hypothetical protein